MVSIKRFEDIEARKTAREVTKRIYELTGSGAFSRDFALRDQIRRSSASIMSNIAEGFEQEGNKEFINFLSMAKGSCGEARSQLYIAFEQNFISETDFRWAYENLDRIGKMISGLMTYLKQADMRGRKFA
jgi:four helix bundle protein